MPHSLDIGLNDFRLQVCLASGREDFLHMKRTQHELAMIMCEDDRYEVLWAFIAKSCQNLRKLTFD